MRKFIKLNDNNQIILSLHRNNGSFSLALNLEPTCDNTLSFGVGLPFLFNFYFTLDSVFLSKQKFWNKLISTEYEPRFNSISVFKDESVCGGYNIMLELWATHSSDTTFFSRFININTIIFGDYDVKVETKNTWNERIFIPAAGGYEGEYYDLVVSEDFYSYKWKRFNRYMAFNRFNVDCEKGVPDRVKWGTQNRCYGITLAADSCSSKDEAIKKFIEDIQETRLK